jgi:recombination protein RecA
VFNCRTRRRKRGKIGVPSKKQQRLNQVAEAVQKRWGDHVLRTPDSLRPDSPPVISTGFPVLDRALGIGGLPRGRLTELLGIPTSGKSTLALHIVASAQAGNDTAVYIDFARTFDPEYAAGCGVNLTTLLLVRPHDRREGLQLCRNLIALSHVGVLIVDFGVAPTPGYDTNGGIGAIVHPLATSPSVLVVLHSSSQVKSAALSHHAALRLRVERQRWLRQAEDIRGWRTRITVLKNHFAPLPHPIGITIGFDRDAP